MITNTIAGPEFNTLLARATQAESPSEFERAKSRLIALIDGWGLHLQHKAVEEFKVLCKIQGLVACDEAKLDKLMHGAAIPRHLLDDFVQIKQSTFNTELKATDLTPFFTIKEDDDLNTLLNDTAFMVESGGNMDTGIAWHEGLLRVLSRLKQQTQSEKLAELSMPETEAELEHLLLTVSDAFLSEGLWAEYVASGKPLGDHLAAEHHDVRFSRLDDFLNEVDDYTGVSLYEVFGDGIVEYDYRSLLRALWRYMEDQSDDDSCGPLDAGEDDEVDATASVGGRLADLGPNFFPTLQWKSFTNGSLKFLALLNPRDNEHDCYDEFVEALEEEFEFRLNLNNPAHEMLALTFDQLVQFIIKAGGK